MSIEKPYVPSSEEVKKAEEMMTPEEKRMSNERSDTFEAGRKKEAGEVLHDTFVGTDIGSSLNLKIIKKDGELNFYIYNSDGKRMDGQKESEVSKEDAVGFLKSKIEELESERGILFEKEHVDGRVEEIKNIIKSIQ